jgi:oligosaccharide repeat unit polymerase
MFLDWLVLFLVSIFLSYFILRFYNYDGWTHPVVIVGGWMVFFIFFDALYILITRTFGPGQFTRYPIEDLEIAQSLLLWFFAFCFFVIGVILAKYIIGFAKAKSNSNHILKKRSNIFLIIIATFFTLFGFFLIIQKVHSMGYSINAMPQIRNLIFHDGGLLLILIQFLPVALLLYLGDKFARKEHIKISIFFALLISSIISLSLGSRSILIYGFILPLLTMYHLLYKKIQIKKIFFIGVISILLIVVLYRTLARDIHFQDNINVSTQEVLLNNFTSLPQFIWGGFEVSSLDGTIDVIRKTHDFIMGESVMNALVSFVPRSIWVNKPLGGGNTIYTSTYYPSFYSSMNAEYSISGVGDLYLNFSYFGIFFFIVFGFFYGLLYYYMKQMLTSYNQMVTLATLIYSLLIYRFFSFLRGDLFNFIGQGIASLIPLLAIAIIYLIPNMKWEPKR